MNRSTMLPPLLALILLVFPFARTFLGDEPYVERGKVTNAALLYWQAFALLPELSAEDTQLLAQIEQGEKPPTDALPLVDRGSQAFSIVQDVSPRTACRWEIIEDGPSTLLPHVGKAHLLARMLVIRARIDAANGKYDEAVDRLAAALLVGRNVDEGALIHLTVGNAIDTLVLDAAEPLLPKLPGPSLDRFSAYLEKMPARAEFAQAIAYERDLFGEWLRAEIASDPKMVRELLTNMQLNAKTLEAVVLLFKSKEARTASLDEFMAEYDKLIAAAKLPEAKARAQIKRLEAAIEKSSNPFTRALLPGTFTVYQRHAETEANFKKFESALSAASSPSEPSK